MSSRVRILLLILASTAIIGADGPDTRTYIVPLSAAAEVTSAGIGEAGDDDGAGQVRLAVNPADRRICYDFTLSGLATPLMAHIHRAPAMRIGPSVVTLFTGPSEDLSKCLTWTEERLAEIVDNPSTFYVNVYTTEYPDGALRGQLSG